MEQLGINPTLLLAQVVNFLILLALLARFVYKPMLKLMRNRQKRIEEGLELARTMEEEREKLAQTRQEVLDKANEKAEKIVAKARTNADKERERLLEEARLEAKKLIEEGLKILEAKQEEAQTKMQQDIAELAITLSERLLREKIDRKKQKQVLKEQIEELRKKDVSKIH